VKVDDAIAMDENWIPKLEKEAQRSAQLLFVAHFLQERFVGALLPAAGPWDGFGIGRYGHGYLARSIDLEGRTDHEMSLAIADCRQ